ncbi:helix-turn-helix domain-containing protein [Actinoplanes sp. NPDC051851]|uniref:helix-turn-helix domain-containing protein n=1 Tax=Actinoplanes sp. NPDC051851 TaxID=3154753 RepID=UPI003443C80D
MDDLHARLREAREAEGKKASAVAAAANVSAAHLCNIEAGRRQLTDEVILAYAQVLGEDCMQRRGLILGTIGAGLLGPAAAHQLIERGFNAALSKKGAEDKWRAGVLQYGRDYMEIGAAKLQDRLATDLVLIQQQLDTPGMWAAAARLLTTYGKTSGDPTEAIRWYRLAVQAADRSEDTSTRVWVRGRAAIALAYEGAALGTAQQLATKAIGLSDKPSLGRLNSLVALAHVAGNRGDHAAAVTADDNARKLFDRIGSEDAEISDFAVPGWRMATFRSMLYARLGDVRRGQAAQDEADDGRPAALVRFQTHIELHRGLMMAKSGDKAGGLAYAQAAMNALPPEKRSQTLRLVLAEVARAGA